MTEVALDDLCVYARCPLEWFWERRVGVNRPRTVTDLVPEALQAALALYYSGHAESLGLAVGLVWRDWCEGWGKAAITAELSRYARERAAILNRITRPDGGRYVAPEMTTAYREHLHTSGLVDLGRRLDGFARSRGLLLPDEDNRVGSVLGDTYADCLFAAERVSQNRENPLPARETVLGWQTPYQVALDNGTRLIGVAALVTRTMPEPNAEAVTLEVHDFHKCSGLRASWASRDLRVIAASLAQPVVGTTSAVTWERVARVVYRHWPSGQAFTFTETNVGHLLAIVTATIRGMESHVIIPRALIGYDDCRACAYRAHCWGESWENLHLIDAGVLGRAEQLRTITRRLREALRGDDQATRRALQAIQVVCEGLSSIGVEATLQETTHHLEVILNER